MASEYRIRTKQIEQQAEGYLELGMSQQALDTFARLGNPDQYSPKALYLSGEALRSLGRYQEALLPLGRAAEASPENIHVRLALGWCHKRNAQLDLAIQDIQAALKTEPAGEPSALQSGLLPEPCGKEEAGPDASRPRLADGFPLP